MKRNSIVMILYVMVFLLAVSMKMRYERPQEKSTPIYTLFPNSFVQVSSSFKSDSVYVTLFGQPLSDETILYTLDSSETHFSEHLISISRNSSTFYAYIRNRNSRLELVSLNTIDINQEILEAVAAFLGNPIDNRTGIPQLNKNKTVRPNRRILHTNTDFFQIQKPYYVHNHSISLRYLKKIEKDLYASGKNVKIQLERSDNNDNRASFYSIGTQISDTTYVEISSSTYFEDDKNHFVVSIKPYDSKNQNILYGIDVSRSLSDFQIVSSELVGEAYYGLPASSIISVSGSPIEPGGYIIQDVTDPYNIIQLPISNSSIRDGYLLEVQHDAGSLRLGENRYRAIVRARDGYERKRDWSFNVRSPGFSIDPQIIPVTMTGIERELFDEYMRTGSGEIVYESRAIHIFPQLTGIRTGNIDTGNRSNPVDIQYEVEFMNNQNRRISIRNWTGGERLGREVHTVPNGTASVAVRAKGQNRIIEERIYDIRPYNLSTENYMVQTIGGGRFSIDNNGNKYVDLRVVNRFGDNVAPEFYQNNIRVNGSLPQRISVLDNSGLVRVIFPLNFRSELPVDISIGLRNPIGISSEQISLVDVRVNPPN